MSSSARRLTALITGPTSGIGRATTQLLAARGWDLILLARNADRGTALLHSLRQRHPQGRFELIIADLAELHSIRKCAPQVRSVTGQLDLLLNNAGARFDLYESTRDGIERTFATNHLGHFLLTGLLMECLMAAPSARVINVSSSAHATANRFLNWQMSPLDFDRRQAYARSKLANLMFTFELGRRLRGFGVTVNAVHPGGVISGFARNNGLMSWLRHLLAHALKRDLIGPIRGADTVVYLATDKAVAGQTGGYYYRRRPIEPSPLAKETELAHQLWALSLDLTGLGEFSETEVGKIMRPSLQQMRTQPGDNA